MPGTFNAMLRRFDLPMSSETTSTIEQARHSGGSSDACGSARGNAVSGNNQPGMLNNVNDIYPSERRTHKLRPDSALTKLESVTFSEQHYQNN